MPILFADIAPVGPLSDWNKYTTTSFNDTNNTIMALIRRCPEVLPALSFLDPIGRTVFNRIQVRQLLRDLDVLGKISVSKDEELVLQGIRRVAVQENGQPRFYVMAIGD